MMGCSNSELIMKELIMKKSFGALAASINRYVPVLSITLLGLVVLLSSAMPAAAGHGGSAPAARSLVRPDCNAIFRYCHQRSTRKSITLRYSVVAQALLSIFSSFRF